MPGLFKRLTTRITIMTLLVAMLPLLFFAVFSLNINRQSLINQINSNNLAIAQRGQNLIEEAITGLEHSLMLVENTVDLPGLSYDDLEWELNSLRSFFDEVQSQTVVDGSGKEIIKFDRDRNVAASELGDRNQDKIFTQALAGKTALGPVTVSDRGARRMEMALPIKNLQTGMVERVLITVISLRNLLSAVASIKVGNTGTIFVSDRQGRLIAHTDRNRVFDKDSTVYANPFVQEFKAGQTVSPPHIYVNHDGIEVLGAASAVDTPEWIVVVELPTAEGMQSINRQLRLMLAVLVGVLLLAGLVSVSVMLKMIRPLKRLETGAESIKSGQLDVVIPVTSDDEIGTVSRAFNSMSAELASREREKADIAWHRNGKLQLDEVMRSADGIDDLAAKVINFLGDYLEAPAGAFFVKHEKKGFTCIAGRALAAETEKVPHFQNGEGLVGQAALEKKIRIFQAPEDYLKVVSGLGEKQPGQVLIGPLVYRNEFVNGVIELGFFGGIPQRVERFLEQNGEALAIVLASLQSREQTEKALEQSQQLTEELETQTEELQTQAEELRVSNEELETQTQKLQSSEEELRVSNEELESRNESIKRFNEEINRRNRELQQAKEVLEQKSKDLAVTSKYKSEFLANMSHELRTPLNSLLILSQDLAKNHTGNLTETQVEASEIIYNSGNDLLRLINDILDISKIESGKVALNNKTIDLEDLIQRLDTTFRRQAEDKGLALTFELDAALHDSLVSDPQRLEQIVKNFISNSIKFTEKGQIGVHFRRPAPETVFIRRELTPENSIAVSVADTGIGIPADHHQQVFEAFQQVDGSISRRFGGTGLGLSISRELANILGGEIQLQSRENEGSTFTLFLPLEPDEAAAGTQAPKPEDHFSPDTAGDVIPAEKPPGRRTPAAPRIKDDQDTLQPGDLVILVIEDDPNFAGIIFRFSHEKGFKCLHAADGETGLELVEKFMPDAVILDISLPGMDGYTVLDRLKDNDKTRNIPVHVMSAYDQDVETLNQRTIGYLKKPVLKKDLDTAFARISTKLSKQMRKLLLVEDDVDQSLAIQKVIDIDGLEIIVVTTGRDALDLLKAESFDGVVLDLNLPDMTGLELLIRLKEENLRIPPVVIYTAEEISRKEEEDLQEFTPSIILKGAMSVARLKDETALFLHRVVKDLPQEKQERINRRQNFDEAFADRSVLLVDDDMRNVFAVGKILSDSGMKVHKAADGRKALEILAKEPDIDLVLMDIMMPVMDGYTAIKNIRNSGKKYSDIPIIALTAKAMPEDRNKCLNAGANDYLTKPIDIDLLFSMLHKYLEKQDEAEDEEHKNGE